MKKLEDYVISIPDFPEKGIIFRDVTSILQDADGLKLSIDSLQKFLEGVDFDVIAGTESRGFIFGVPVAYNLHKPFIPIRKKGIQPGQKVVIIDDLIATGGTVKAAAELFEQLGGEVVKMIFVMELSGLNGREKLAGYDIDSAIIYEGK